MQITNGTFTRKFRTADFEDRTVSLSFTVDPGDDVDAALLHISFMAEKHARQMPPLGEPVHAPQTAEPAAAPKGRGRRAPVIETTASVSPTVAPTVQAEPSVPSPSIVPAPATGVSPTLPAAASEATSASIVPAATPVSGAPSPSVSGPIAPTTASPSDRELTSDDINHVIGLARRIWLVPGTAIEQARNAATGVAGMSIFAPEATQQMKRAFLAGIEALNPNVAPEKY